MVTIIVFHIDRRITSTMGRLTDQSALSGLYVLGMRMPATLTIIVDKLLTTDECIKFQFVMLSFMHVADPYLWS